MGNALRTADGLVICSSRTAGEANGAVSACTQANMKDARQTAKASGKGKDSLVIVIHPTGTTNINDLEVPLDRQLYDHPLAGSLWERKLPRKFGTVETFGLSFLSSQSQAVLVSFR